MRKNLLLLAAAAVLSLTTANAQKEWNFSNFTAGSITTATTVDGLTISPTSENSIDIDANKKSIDEYSFTQRLKFGGSGIPLTEGTMIPEGRHISFPVDGPVDITVYGMSSSSTAERTLVVTDGTNEVGTFVNGGTAINKAEISYTGGAATLYMYSASGGFNLYLVKYVASAASGIESENVDRGEIVSATYYDLSGRIATENTTGFVIKKAVYEDGSVETTKTYVRQ